MKRSTALGAVMATLVAVVVAGAVMWPGDPVRPMSANPTAPPPNSLEDLPVGPATSVPWWQDGTLHVGQTTIETPLQIVLFGNGTTVVGRANAGRGSAWFVVRGSSLQPLVRSPDLVHAEVSDDGRTIVWIDPVAEDRRRITAYDVDSGSVTGTIEIPVETFCCTGNGEVFLAGVATDGLVVWWIDRAAFVWRPAALAAVRVDMPDRQLSADSWPGGLMWQGGSNSKYSAPGVFATVSEAGAVHRVGTVPTDQLGRWSPDGSAYAYPDSGRTWVQDIGTGERRRLDLPTTLPFGLVTWESPHAVILETRLPFDGTDDPNAGVQALVRCDTGSGSCERVSGAPTGVPVLPY